MATYTIKRVYEDAAPDDGRRILVDRLWPRGVRKADLDATWDKDLAPSPELRKDWNHDPERFDAFASAYRKELEGRGQELLDRARAEIDGADRVTLLYAAKDPQVNHAVVLRDWLTEKLG